MVILRGGQLFCMSEVPLYGMCTTLISDCPLNSWTCYRVRIRMPTEREISLLTTYWCEST